MWSLSGAWYGDRLAASYAPRSAAKAQRLLDEVGLTGAFWQLQR